MKLDLTQFKELKLVLQELDRCRKEDSILEIVGGEPLSWDLILILLKRVESLHFKEVIIETTAAPLVNSKLVNQIAAYDFTYIVPWGDYYSLAGALSLIRASSRVYFKINIDDDVLPEFNELIEYLKGLGFRRFLLNIKVPLENAVPAIKQLDKSLDLRFGNYEREMSILLNNMFIGPIVTQFEITNTCNHQCVFCYHHSPHLLDKDDPYFKTHKFDKELVKRSNEWHKKRIDYKLLKSYVNDSIKSGCKYIQLAGGGEPTTHPDLMKMISLIKNKGASVQVFTNFVLPTKPMIKKMVKLGLDILEINFSGDNAATYSKIHSQDHFDRVVANLKYLKQLKEEQNVSKPEVRIMNPITSVNYKEVPGMVRLAEELGASAVYLGHLQTTPQTKYLLIKKKHIEELNTMLPKISTSLSNNFQYFLEVLNEKGTLKGSHTKKIFNKVGCLMPFYETQIHLNGEVAPCCLHPPIFSIKGRKFMDVWNSPEYKEFRKKVLSLYKKDEKQFLCRGCRMCVYQEDIQRFYNGLKEMNLIKFLK